MNEKNIFSYYQLTDSPQFKELLKPYLEPENFKLHDLKKSLNQNKNHDVILVDAQNVAHKYINSASHDGSYAKINDSYYQIGILLSLARFVRLLNDSFPYASILLVTDDPDSKVDKYQRRHEMKSDLHTAENFISNGNSDDWINTCIDHITMGKRPYRVFSPGAEADETIKSVVKMWKEVPDKPESVKMILVSSDVDVISNISEDDNVHVISQYNTFVNFNTGMSPLTNEVTESEFISEHGIEPAFYPFHKLMIGKLSDGYDPLAPTRSVTKIINRMIDPDDIYGNIMTLSDYFKSVNINTIIGRAHSIFRNVIPLCKEMNLEHTSYSMAEDTLNIMFTASRSDVETIRNTERMRP